MNPRITYQKRGDFWHFRIVFADGTAVIGDTRGTRADAERCAKKHAASFSLPRERVAS